MPRIAITMGDPAGVGPELCLRLLREPSLREVCVPIVYGDANLLARVAKTLGWTEPTLVLDASEWPENGADLDSPAVLHLGGLDAAEVIPGEVSASCGEAAYRYITSAIDAALAGRVDAVCTAPIHKEALAAAGVPFPGHTEIFTTRTDAERSCMMLTSEQITCSLVTAHVGYRDVPGQLSIDRIRDTIELTTEAMRRIRGREPKLVICGLNPHAGEHGLFGDREEERFIVPATEQARAAGIAIDGPYPPDTAFLPWRRKTTDAYICMYHDQGLIPLKALAFDEAINITLGLPIIRTSVDHGTAFDIAWRGKANPQSLFEATRLAAKLARVPKPISTA